MKLILKRSALLALVMVLLCNFAARSQLLLPGAEAIALMENRSTPSEIAHLLSCGSSQKKRNHLTVQQLTIDYSQPFLSKLTTSIQLSYLRKLKFANVILATSHSGSSIFQESSLQIAVQKSLSNTIAASMMLGVSRGAGAELIPFYLPLLNINLLAKINDQLYLGFFVSNPLKIRSGQNIWSIRYPEMKLGINYRITDDLGFLTELSSGQQNSFLASSSIRYQLDQKTEFLGGIRWTDFSFSAGFQYQFNDFTIQLAVYQNALPASSPASSLKFLW